MKLLAPFGLGVLVIAMAAPASGNPSNQDMPKPGASRPDLLKAPTEGVVRASFDCVVGQDHIARGCVLEKATPAVPAKYLQALANFERALRVPRPAQRPGAHFHATATVVLKNNANR